MRMRKKEKKNSPSTAPDNQKGIRVFVYGTLKRMHYNHELISGPNVKGNEFLGLTYIEGPYRMRHLGWFPGVQFTVDPKHKQRIYGEVYRVTEDTLKALDILEGNGQFFTRHQVETPWKKAWMYMIPANYDNPNRPAIEGGSWQPNSAEKDFIASDKKQLDAVDYNKISVITA